MAPAPAPGKQGCGVDQISATPTPTPAWKNRLRLQLRLRPTSVSFSTCRRAMLIKQRYLLCNAFASVIVIILLAKWTTNLSNSLRGPRINELTCKLGDNYPAVNQNGLSDRTSPLVKVKGVLKQLYPYSPGSKRNPSDKKQVHDKPSAVCSQPAIFCFYLCFHLD